MTEWKPHSVLYLHLQPLLRSVKGENGDLGAESGEAAAEDALGHGDPPRGEDRIEDLVEERVEAELEAGVGPNGGEGRHEAPEEGPGALGPPHLSGGVDGARVRPLVPLSHEPRPDDVEGVRGESGRDPRRRAQAEMRGCAAQSFLRCPGGDPVQCLKL